MEEIVPFSATQLPNHERFGIQMTGITFPDKNYHIQRTGEPVYVFEYVINGQGYISVGNEHFSPHKGDVYVLPPNTVQDYRSLPSNPFHKIWMNISGTLVDSLYEQYNLNKTAYYPSKPAYNLFSTFYETCRDNKTNPQYISYRGSLIIHELIALIAQDESIKQCSIQSQYAQQTKKYIDINVQKNLKANEIANAIGISTSQLTRCFLAEYGTTPYAYYTNTRIDLACALLRNSAMQIKEIARTLNYADEHYFSVTFKTQIGMSPREYRKKFR